MAGAAAAIALIVGVSWRTAPRKAGPVASDARVEASPAAGSPSPPPSRPVAEAETAFEDSIASLRQQQQDAARRTVESGRAQLESRFRAEQVDPAWAAATERLLAQSAHGALIGQAAADPQQLSVRCRSSVCRIEATFANSTQADDWLPLFALGAGASMSRAATQRRLDSAGRVQLEVYAFARP